MAGETELLAGPLAQPVPGVRSFKGSTYSRPLVLWWIPAALGVAGFALIPNEVALGSLVVGVVLAVGLSLSRPRLRRKTARLRLTDESVSLDKKPLFRRSEVSGVVAERYRTCWLTTLFDVRGREVTIELAELEHGVLMRELGFQGLPANDFTLSAPPRPWPPLG